MSVITSVSEGHVSLVGVGFEDTNESSCVCMGMSCESSVRFWEGHSVKTLETPGSLTRPFSQFIL